MGIILGALDPKESDTEKIWRACRSLATTDPEDFRSTTKDGRTIELGDGGVGLVGLIAGFYDRMAQEEISSIPEDMRRMISHQIRKVQEAFYAIQTLRQDKPEAAVDTLRNVYSETRMILAPFVRAESMDAEAARRDIARMMEEFGSKDAKIGSILKEAQSTLSVLQDQANRVSAATHAGHFREAAERYEKAKKRWLKAFCGTAGAAIAGALIWVLATGPAPPYFEGMVEAMAGRLFVFGVLGYLVVWTARGYRAAAHNQIVNEHRRDALGTFETFVKGTSDDRTKNAVLLQATHCIFSHRPSGFGQQETDATSPIHLPAFAGAVVEEGPGQSQQSN
ncbi:MAG: hypothetical protein OXH49_08435 [Gemmatimonadetes bacterium]|nr:hypothetical protein [Gemmatimonadota bacterium]